MQQVATQNNTQNTTGVGLVLSLEILLYIALLVFSLAVHLAEIDTVPMNITETSSALSAWRDVSPQTIDIPNEIASSPALYWAQRLGFSLLGNGEMQARVLTVIAGVLVAFVPLLFRDVLGSTRTVMAVLLLNFSPILFLASRFGGATVWAILFAGLTLWMLKRYWFSGQQSDGIGVIVAFSALLLLSNAVGLLMGITLALALYVAIFLAVPMSAPEDSTHHPTRQQIIERRNNLPLLNGIGIAVLVVAGVATGFMLYPQGLSMIGAVFGSLFANNTPVQTPFAFPVMIAFFYETLLFVFVAISMFLFRRRGYLGFIDTFLWFWLIFNVIVLLLVPNGSADSALLMLIPLTLLASFSLSRLFTRDRMLSIWLDDIEDKDVGHLYSTQWGKWMTAAIYVALLMMLSIHVQELSRQVLFAPDSSLQSFFDRLAQGVAPNMQNSLLWAFISVSFLLVGAFLAGGIWGTKTTLQGIGLGILGFMLISNIAGGWQTAVTNASNPVELWHVIATDDDYWLLRESLQDVATRETQGEKAIPLTVVLEDGITRNGVTAWAVRDFTDVTFVDDIDAARRDQIIMVSERPTAGLIAPADEELDLGGTYVGQNFTLATTWDQTSVGGMDFLPWYMFRQARVLPVPYETSTLWLRGDVYNGNPVEEPDDGAQG